MSSGTEEQLRGDIAQGELERLAREAGLVPIKPDPDRTGWDYCVEELESSSTLPVDIRPAAWRWMVQVKAVGRTDSAVQIKLSNWQRMVKQGLPWFVLVVRVVERQPVAAFLVHVNEFWIRRTLERLTQLASKKQERLHQRSLSLKWRPEDEIAPRSGEAFAAMLRRAVGGADCEPHAYSRKKQRFLESVGYEGPSYQGTMKIAVQGFEPLAEFAVGLRPNLPIVDATVDRVRFGIRIREAEASAGTLRLSLARSRRVRLTATRDKVPSRCTVEFDAVKATDVFPFLPEAHDRAVLRHPALELQLHGSSSSIDFNYCIGDLDAHIPLSEVGAASEFVSILADATTDVPVEIQSEGGPALMHALRNLPSEMANNARGLASPVASAWAIARRFGLEQVDVVPRLLLAQRDRLLMARAALEAWPGSASVGDIDPGAKMDDGVSAIVGGFTTVLLGNMVYTAVTTCVGRAKEVQGQGFPQVILEQGVFRAHGARVLPKAQFDAQVDSIRAELLEVMQSDLDASGVANTYTFREP